MCKAKNAAFDRTRSTPRRFVLRTHQSHSGTNAPRLASVPQQRSLSREYQREYGEIEAAVGL
jgi:hypothetical protein